MGAVQTFESVIGANGVSFFRVTNTNDQVPHFPPSDKIMQPGFQVWLKEPGSCGAGAYQLCGNQLDAPTCGNAGIPKKSLCKMSGSNPASLQCGGTAPYNGPHCAIACAPMGNVCS